MANLKDDYLSGLLAKDPVVVRKIYKEFRPRIEKVIRTHGGTSSDAKDVFQEALIVVWRKAKVPSFQLTSSFYSYLHGVAYFIWLRKRKKKDNNTVTLENVEELKDVWDIDQQLELSDRRKLFRKHFKQLDAACQQILRLFFIGEKMQDIAERLNIENEHAARNRKYRCQKKLEQRILNDPLSIELSS